MVGFWLWFVAGFATVFRNPQHDRIEIELSKKHIVKSTGILCFYRFYRDCSNWSKHEYVDPIYLFHYRNPYILVPTSRFGVDRFGFAHDECFDLYWIFHKVDRVYREKPTSNLHKGFSWMFLQLTWCHGQRIPALCCCGRSILYTWSYLGLSQEKSLQANLQNLTVDHRLTH